ncbi:MAG: ribosome maturation factor RimM [Pseudohongiellaceae bacterium]|jgi:16S rRNA processing protein RimM
MQSQAAVGKRVVMARVGKPHGIKGWLRLDSYTSPADNLLQYNEFIVRMEGQEKRLTLDESRQQSGKLVGHFVGYDAPESARELTGLELLIDSSELPTLETGDYYWYQLLGLRVVNLEDQDFGTVARLMETGANDVLIVKPDRDSIDSRERLIPYLPETVVRQVDLQSATVRVDWQADYLA